MERAHKALYYFGCSRIPCLISRKEESHGRARRNAGEGKQQERSVNRRPSNGAFAIRALVRWDISCPKRGIGCGVRLETLGRRRAGRDAGAHWMRTPESAHTCGSRVALVKGVPSADGGGFDWYRQLFFI